MKKYLLIASLFANFIFIAAGAFGIHKYGGLRNLLFKIANRGIDVPYELRKSMFEVLPEKEGAIVFLGNSITAGNEWAEMFNNPNIINRAISGDHCDGIRERLDDVLRHKPSKIFLLIGLNDLGYHPANVVVEKYKRLVDDILKKSPATALYLQSVFPINEEVAQYSMKSADIRILNEGIKALAEDKKLPFIDLYPLLLDKDGNLDFEYTNDGIHLNGKAYLKWKEAIQPIVLEER